MPSLSGALPHPRLLVVTLTHRQNALLVGLTAGAMLAPLLFHASQLMAGMLVNGLLVLGALTLHSRLRLLPLIMLPCLVATGAGWFSGTTGPGLLLLIPGIWLANAVYVELFRRSRQVWMIPLAATAKTLVLLGVTALLVSAQMLPARFLEIFAPLQWVTATAGAVLALGAHTGLTHLMK